MVLLHHLDVQSCLPANFVLKQCHVTAPSRTTPSDLIIMKGFTLQCLPVKEPRRPKRYTLHFQNTQPRNQPRQQQLVFARAQGNGGLRPRAIVATLPLLFVYQANVHPRVAWWMTQCAKEASTLEGQVNWRTGRSTTQTDCKTVTRLRVVCFLRRTGTDTATASVLL